MDDDLSRLVNALQKLGPEKLWCAPDGYPNSLGLCILDAIWSIGVNYDDHVVPVINRYRAHRSRDGFEADKDSAKDLYRTIAEIGYETFATVVVKNHQRTSTRSGILKAEACLRATTHFGNSSIITCEDFKEHQSHAEAGWCRIPGQKSGISWRYLRILTGEPDIKPDRMITRFVGAALTREVSPDESVELLKGAHGQMKLKTDLRTLDHAIWDYQRNLKKKQPRLPSFSLESKIGFPKIF